jgi:transcriptional regulator NrdR family protein
MECQRCKSKVRRYRTISQGKQVTRYNRCPACGATFKTIELYESELHAERKEQVLKLVESHTTARNLGRAMDSVKEAFSSLRDAITPEPIIKQLPHRYTRDFKSR